MGGDRGSGGDRYDYYSRNAPSQSQIPPRFLKQKQHQGGPSGRAEDEGGRPMSQPPKEIRLPTRDRERDDRGPDRERERDRERDRDRDRGSYESRGDRREWRDDREVRDSEPVHSGYKRSYDNKDRPIENWSRERQERDSEKRPHHQRSSMEAPLRGGDWTEKDTLNGKRKDKDLDADLERDRPNSRDSRSSNRETSVSKEDSGKEKANAAPLYPLLDTEIVSWADEPADDEAAPLTVVLQSRGFGEDGRSQLSSKGGSHAHHTPVPISREKLEADVSREAKSNLVPLRRMQNQSQQAHGIGGGSGQACSNSPHSENDNDKKNRSSEVVENVWASRSKTREQLQQQEREREQTKPDEKENREDKKSVANPSDKPTSAQHPPETAADGKSKMEKTDSEYLEHDSHDSDKNRKGAAKEIRGVRSSASGSAGARGGGGGKGSAGGPPSRQRGGRSRAYDEYYEEENGNSYKSQDASDDRFKSTEIRKSKSPIEEDRDDPRKDRVEDQRSRGGNSGPFRGGRRGQRYDEEEARSKEGLQRAPRFQQHDDGGKAPVVNLREKSNKSGPALTQQTSQDGSGVETWETHSEHSGGDSAGGTGRFNRRGRGGAGGGSAGDRRTGGRPDRAGKSEQSNHSDYSERHKETDSTVRESADTGAKDAANEQERDDRKFKENKSSGSGANSGERYKDEKGRPSSSSSHPTQSQAGHSVDDMSGPKRPRKDDTQQRKENQQRGGDDRRFQRPVKSGDRFDSRPKSNLPPRLARLSESGRFKHNKAENEVVEGASGQGLNKDSTPPPQQSNPWEKTVPSSSSGAGSGGSLSMASDVDRLSSQTAALIIDDSAPDRDGEKPILDGSTPPVQTIIFENTNFKSSSSAAAAAAAAAASVSLGSSDMKGGKSTPPGQPQQQLPKAGIKVQQQQQQQLQQQQQQQQSLQQQQQAQQSEGQKTSISGNLKGESSLQMPMPVGKRVFFHSTCSVRS